MRSIDLQRLDCPCRAFFPQKTVPAVLKILLPERDTDIKVQMSLRQELLEASGYANRTRDSRNVGWMNTDGRCTRLLAASFDRCEPV
jgi:hypothetical protein